jgi:hypothetical protein
MTSVVSGGTTDRMASRIWFIALRAGSGMAAKYSSTVLGAAGFKACFGAAFFGARGLVARVFKAPACLVAEGRLPDFAFFMRAMLQQVPMQVHAASQSKAMKREQNANRI